MLKKEHGLASSVVVTIIILAGTVASIFTFYRNLARKLPLLQVARWIAVFVDFLLKITYNKVSGNTKERRKLNEINHK